MKRKQLIWQLESLDTFQQPKLQLEQYATSAEMAAEILEAIEREEELSGKIVGDFGCGPGILLIGAALMGAQRCVGYEIDEEVAQICRHNIEETELADMCCVEVKDILLDFRPNDDVDFDVIVMNPPFGTKNNEGIDLQFVQAAIKVLKVGGSAYSLHKTSTREGILRRAQSWSGVEATVFAQMRWELPRTYKHQQKETLDITVDLIRYKKRS